MSLSTLLLAPILSAFLLTACGTTPRYAHQPPRIEVPTECCCETPQPCRRADCAVLNPDHLDDFGPRLGQKRVRMCHGWHNVARFDDQCPKLSDRVPLAPLRQSKF